MNGDEGLKGRLGTGKAVLAFGTESDASFSFDQSGCDLGYHGLHAIRAAPTLFGEEFHADSSAGEDVAPTDDWTNDATEWGFEWKVLFERHIQEYRVFPLLLLE